MRTYAVAIPLGQGQVFNYRKEYEQAIRKRSQSLWVRDRFLMAGASKPSQFSASQSLWVRDRFLIVRGVFSPCFQCVAEGVSNFCFCEKVGASAVVFIRVFHGVFGVALFR